MGVDLKVSGLGFRDISPTGNDMETEIVLWFKGLGIWRYMGLI